MPDPSPAWQDEAFAGTLFPAARPIPAKWIANDYQALTTVEDFRAEQSSRAAQRDAVRAQEQSPEAQEAAWRQAHEQARLEMRRERQWGRIAAGIEPAAAPLDYPSSYESIYPGYCESFVEDVLGHIAFHSGGIVQAFSGLTHVLTEAANALNAMSVSITPGTWLPSGHADALKRAVQSMDALAAPAPNRKPVPQYRERYLPGTRHARRGR